MTVGDLLDQAIERFRAIGSPTAHLDAELLIGEALGMDRVQLRTRRDDMVSDTNIAAALSFTQRRENLEPVQYILGRAHFRNLELTVDSRVLVPRPETEFLVEAALAALRAFADEDPRPLRVLDLCTGSGAVALAIADEGPTSTHVTATDISSDALAVARSNAERIGLQIELCQGDLAAPVVGRKFDVITVNPPYIGQSEIPSLGIGVAEHEPHVALFTPSPDPEPFLRRVVKESETLLADGGLLAIEVGAGQHATVGHMFLQSGLRGVETVEDLAGIGRVVVGIKLE